VCVYVNDYFPHELLHYDYDYGYVYALVLKQKRFIKEPIPEIRLQLRYFRKYNK